MMLCKADFEELFPSLFKTKDHTLGEAQLSSGNDCISRWKDDGGSVLALPAREHAPALHAGLAVVKMSAAIAHGITWAMFLAPYDHLTGERKKRRG